MRQSLKQNIRVKICLIIQDKMHPKPLMTNQPNNPPRKFKSEFSESEIQIAIKILQGISDDTSQLTYLSKEDRIALLRACGEISRPDRQEIRKRKRDSRRLKNHRTDQHQRTLRKETGIRSARETAVFIAPSSVEDSSRNSQVEKHLIKPTNCYICKVLYTRMHFFYDSLCPKCAAFNYAKRFQTAPLDGKTALITGSRLKIGYQASLMMLRAGARVIATTRFPVNSSYRYSREKDFAQWKDRLHIYGLDLRHTPSVELFCNYIKGAYDRLDILVNNAAQTVRRPPGFYAHMMIDELTPIDELPPDARGLLQPFENCKRSLSLGGPVKLAGQSLSVAWSGKMQGVGINASAQLSQVPYMHDAALQTELVFPEKKLDADLQ